MELLPRPGSSTEMLASVTDLGRTRSGLRFRPITDIQRAYDTHFNYGVTEGAANEDVAALNTAAERYMPPGRPPFVTSIFGFEEGVNNYAGVSDALGREIDVAEKKGWDRAVAIPLPEVVDNRDIIFHTYSLNNPIITLALPVPTTATSHLFVVVNAGMHLTLYIFTGGLRQGKIYSVGLGATRENVTPDGAQSGTVVSEPVPSVRVAQGVPSTVPVVPGAAAKRRGSITAAVRGGGLTEQSVNLVNNLMVQFDGRNPAVLYSPDFITRSAVSKDVGTVRIIDVGFFTPAHHAKLQGIVNGFNNGADDSRKRGDKDPRKLRFVTKRTSNGSSIFGFDHMEIELSDIGYGLIGTERDLDPDSHYFSEKARANCTSWLQALFAGRFKCTPSVLDRIGVGAVSPNLCRSNYTTTPRQDLITYVNTMGVPGGPPADLLGKMRGDTQLGLAARVPRFIGNVRATAESAAAELRRRIGRGRRTHRKKRKARKTRRTLKASRR